MIYKDPLVRRQQLEQLSMVFDSANAGRSLKQKRDFLLKCIEDHGYISERTVQPETFHDAVEYTEFENENFYETGEGYQEYTDTATYSDPYGFNRTFVGADEKDKLVKIQQRGISSEETNLQKVREIMDNIVNQVNQDFQGIDVTKVVNTALHFYKKILNYYSAGNKYNIETNAKGIKKGYVVLCVEYALVFTGNPVETDRLLSYFNYLKIVVPNLPKVRTYILKIMPELHNFQVKNTTRTTECNIILNMLPISIQNQVNEILKHFPHSYTTAAIYFICSSKEVYKDKIPILIDGIVQNLTLKLLEANCKPPSSTKISKNAQEIADFYKRNYSLREDLLNIS